MLMTMVFHHQSDVSLSLSYCMVGSSNTNLLCFLFDPFNITFNFFFLVALFLFELLDQHNIPFFCFPG